MAKKKAVDHESNLEVPIVYRVCYACGYSEVVDVAEEDTPAKHKYCPNDGSLLYRLSGTELFHLNFVDDPERDPSGIEFVDDPKKQVKSLDYIAKRAPDVKVNTDGIVSLKAEGHEWTFVGKGIRSRFIEQWEQDKVKALRGLRVAYLAFKDNEQLPEQRGIFGQFRPRNVIKKIKYGNPVNLQELRRCKVRVVSDNQHVLRVRVNHDEMAFQPKSNFPLDNHQVSASVFEDFVRRVKNMLNEDSGQALAFLISQGKLVDVKLQASNYSISVAPTSLDEFVRISNVLNTKGIFWRGTTESMQVQGTLEHVKSIIHVINEDVKVLEEETVAGDINPGYVVGSNKSGRKSSKGWLKKFLKGDVVEIENDGEVTFEWRTRLTDTNRKAFTKALLLMGAYMPKILTDKKRKCLVAHMGLVPAQVSVPKWNWVLEQDDLDVEMGLRLPENVDEKIGEMMEQVYEKVKEVPAMWAEDLGFEIDDFYPILDTLLTAFSEAVGTFESENERSITFEDVGVILGSLQANEDNDLTILDSLEMVVGEFELPSYVSLYVLSDVFSSPVTEIEGMYFEFLENSESGDTTGGDQELEDDNVDVDTELTDDNVDVDTEDEDEDLTKE